MKIAQLVSNYYPTSVTSNNGIYYHVGWLTKALIDRGVDVTLFASGDSETQSKLFSVAEKASRASGMSEEQSKHYLHLLISSCFKRADRFDLIHAHFNLLSSFYSQMVDTPTIQSIHSPISPETRDLLHFFKDNNYISFSLAQRRQMPELNWVANIYHGVDMQEFAYNPVPKDYLLYLGRITEDKGVHLAIEAARATNTPLIIAGRSFPQEKYWHEQIEKQIDGKLITYVGEANFRTKVEYLQNAKALLLPAQWQEPFGLVMIEAMATGTPVIGWNNGSIPEVVQDKESGYVVNSMDTMVRAIGSLDKISRQATRDRAEKLFSIEKMVAGYERVYLRIIEEHRAKSQNGKKSAS
jgi:glycosyltransferase involved in cell wall biosynthesis